MEKHEIYIRLIRQIFEEILPQYGYVIREGQVELAKEMVTTLINCNISICEAEVGIGKTHAYIIAAILNSLENRYFNRIRTSYPLTRDYYKTTKMPTVITTSSIALQKAIALDYIPGISGILMKHRLIDRPLTSVIRKGKEHYICDKRIKDFLKSLQGKGNVPQKDLEELQQLHKLQDTSFYDIDLDRYDNISNYAKSRICVTQKCNPSCDMHTVCRYNKFVRHIRSYSHDFQICNHNYFLADTRHRNKGLSPLIPNYRAVIIDEAHKFTGAARQMYGNSISIEELSKLIYYISKMKFCREGIRKTIESYYIRLLNLEQDLFDELLKPVLSCEVEDDTERYKTEITPVAEKTLRSIVYTISSLHQALEDKSCLLDKSKSIHRYVMHCLSELMGKYKTYLVKDNIVYWLEIPMGNLREATGKKLVVRQGIRLCSIPKGLDEILHKELWCKPVPVILTSGTLSVNGCFSHMKKNMGIDRLYCGRLEETSKASPYNYEENSLLYISNNVPFPDNKDMNYIKAVADEVERLITATHGHALVLFTSYRVMEQVYRILVIRKLRYEIIKMNRGLLNPIDIFKQSNNGVLFASGNCWEGIDIPGDTLSSLIIVKLPFAVPDPISEYEQTMYDSFDDYKNKVVFPEMIIKLKQGVGRLIRSETDTGVISILDSRLRVGGNYRDKVLKALPDCHVTSSIDEVERFIKEKKDKSYF